jgi:hypothetical protein
MADKRSRESKLCVIMLRDGRVTRSAASIGSPMYLWNAHHATVKDIHSETWQ